MFRRLISSLLLAGFSASAVHADPIDDLVKANMERDKAPGCAIAIVDPQGKAEIRTYGIASLELPQPVTSKTVFRWASMSKQFAAASIFLLEADGKLKPSDKLLQRLPEGPKEWEAVTLQHVLNHQSGIETPDGLFSFTRDYTWAQYIALAARSPLPGAPGTKFAYSNPGYSLLGAVVEKTSGISLAQFVKSRIFDPAGMASARYFVEGEVVPHRAAGYRVEGDKTFNSLFDRPMVYGGSGGIMGSIEDLVAWDKALRSGSFSKTIQAKMASPGILNDGTKTEYGCGWFLAKEGESEIQNHSGGTNGFTSYQYRDVTKGWSVFVLKNSGMGSSVGLGKAIYQWVIANRR